MTVAPQIEGEENCQNRELLLWRLLSAIFLALTSVALRATSEPEIPVAGLGGGLALLFLSLGGAWVGIRMGVNARTLLVYQVSADMVCIAVLVHLFNFYAAFPLLFTLPVLSGAYYLGRRGAIVVAAIAAVLTGGNQVGISLGWLVGGSVPQLEPAQGSSIVVTVMLILLFLILGVGGGLMFERHLQRKRLQEQASLQVQRARSEVRNILDNIQSGLLILDQVGVITRANPAAETILGIKADTVVGLPIGVALGADKAEFVACAQEALQARRTLTRQELVIRRRAEAIPIGISISHLEDRLGNQVGAIAIFQDLTDVTRMRKRIREADRLAGIGELAASIAHEIRNPLGSIRGCVEILAGELDLKGQHAQLLELILKESARVNTIITEFLSFARLRPAHRSRTSCRVFLDKVALQITQHVAAHGGKVKVSHRVEPAELSADLDPEQMVQLFLNLAINACEAMEYRGELRLSAARSIDGQWCEMKVQDSGPGISPTARADLFKPFVTTKKTGTGLGLPMVARIAHAHDGSVEVGETGRGGAVFCVKVPLAATFGATKTGSAAEQARAVTSETAAGSPISAKVGTAPPGAWPDRPVPAVHDRDAASEDDDNCESLEQLTTV